MKRILEMDGSDGYTTKRMCLTLLKCAKYFTATVLKCSA
jgi:hypothetical protein